MAKQDHVTSRRRSFLKSITALGGVASLSGLSVAEESRPIDQVKQLLRSGDKIGAHEVADDHGISYQNAETEVNLPESSSEPESDSPTVSPDKIYLNPEKNTGTLDLAIYDPANNPREQYAFLNWKLARAGNAGYDGSGPKDGLAISFSDDVYTNLAGEQDGSERVENIHPGTHGIKATCNDIYLDSFEGWLDGHFVTKENEGGITTAIYGEYIHSWDPWGFPQGFGMSLVLPGAGGLAMNINGGSKQYKAQSVVNHVSNF